MRSDSYWSRGGFGYGKHETTDTGQIVELTGAANDEKLVRLGHFREIEKGTKPVQCGRCGLLFIGDGYLVRHGQRRHSGNIAPEREDEMLDSAERFAETVAPIMTDRSAASKGIRAARG